MASPRQNAANKKNAQKSTGPKTDEGKNASKRNALKHGLAGAGVIMTDPDQELIETLKIKFRPSFQPQNADQEFFFEQVVVTSIQLDRCRLQESTIREYQILRASISWDDDRTDDVIELAGKLSKNPLQISRKLQQTKQGTDWMIERWRALGAILDQGGSWDESHTAMALDLTGTPLELREYYDPIAHPASLVACEIEVLERRKVRSLNATDTFERSAAERGCEIQPSRALRNIRRYTAEIMRKHMWARSELSRSRLANPTPLPTPPPPPPPPQPEPPTPSPDDDDDQYKPSQQAPIVYPAFAPEPSRFAASPSFQGPQGNRRARRAAAKQTRRQVA